MRLEQLSFFVEVSHCQSISLAASRLFMSQQNVSTAIRKLEAELGFELFERTHYGVVLTPQGEELLVKAEAILKEIDEIKMIGRSAGEHLTGELRVELVPYIALSEMIVDFYRQNPEVTIKTIEKSPAEIIANLNNGSTDVGFVYLRREETLETLGLEQERLSRDQLYFCVSKKLNYPKRSYTITELLEKKIPLIIFDSLHAWTLEALEMISEQQQNEQQPLVYRADIQLYKRMILNGLAAGFATKMGLEQEIVFSRGEVDALKLKGLYLSVCMLYRKTPTSPLKEKFLSMIREKFLELGTNEIPPLV